MELSVVGPPSHCVVESPVGIGDSVLYVAYTVSSPQGLDESSIVEPL